METITAKVSLWLQFFVFTFPLPIYFFIFFLTVCMYFLPCFSISVFHIKTSLSNISPYFIVFCLGFDVATKLDTGIRKAQAGKRSASFVILDTFSHPSEKFIFLFPLHPHDCALGQIVGAFVLQSQPFKRSR